MKIINFFRNKNGDFEYATCDDGNVYRRYMKKWYGKWSLWELWVTAEDIQNNMIIPDNLKKLDKNYPK